MTAKGKITAAAIYLRAPGTVHILITDDSRGRAASEAARTGQATDVYWHPAYNKTGMVVATVTRAHVAGGRYLLESDRGPIRNVAPAQTFWLAPDRPDDVVVRPDPSDRGVWPEPDPRGLTRDELLVLTPGTRVEVYLASATYTGPSIDPRNGWVPAVVTGSNESLNGQVNLWAEVTYPEGFAGQGGEPTHTAHFTASSLDVRWPADGPNGPAVIACAPNHWPLRETVTETVPQTAPAGLEPVDAFCHSPGGLPGPARGFVANPTRPIVVTTHATNAPPDPGDDSAIPADDRAALAALLPIQWDNGSGPLISIPDRPWDADDPGCQQFARLFWKAWESAYANAPEQAAALLATIAAKEAELGGAQRAFHAEAGRRIGGSSRTKKFARAVDGQLRRAADHHRHADRLGREVAALRAQVGRPAPKPLDLSRLLHATHVRTRVGWYQVVKVNKKTVKVVVERGMDDLIPITRILEIREPAPKPLRHPIDGRGCANAEAAAGMVAAGMRRRTLTVRPGPKGGFGVFDVGTDEKVSPAGDTDADWWPTKARALAAQARVIKGDMDACREKARAIIAAELAAYEAATGTPPGVHDVDGNRVAAGDLVELLDLAAGPMVGRPARITRVIRVTTLGVAIVAGPYERASTRGPAGEGERDVPGDGFRLLPDQTTEGPTVRYSCGCPATVRDAATPPPMDGDVAGWRAATRDLTEQAAADRRHLTGCRWVDPLPLDDDWTERYSAAWSDGTVVLIRDLRVGVCGPFGEWPATSLAEAEAVLRAEGYALTGPWKEYTTGHYAPVTPVPVTVPPLTAVPVVAGYVSGWAGHQ